MPEPWQPGDRIVWRSASGKSYTNRFVRYPSGKLVTLAERKIDRIGLPRGIQPVFVIALEQVVTNLDR